ncbi:OB-fold nucleic acid binding domain-containing protein [Coccidioides immitis RS]|uniref:OB-fold nucleic acid binding domain-containing protein n=4 Tax=Coccidioides immitis TaxID=5501 RepID=A0A0E1RYM7_COCIM|nr:OB-fold nucleic acid binding domain-containing protein [Coccidioides immitis RS]KMP05285.1 OB-fold nucleic acid binding domain [Coccidioides immitis RMSCC 2394]KMU77816.1 OB-fold nucleic acid binding domain containing protein [Coccidioides immitis RMSCC 3703]KMU85745.1 OB-fold nucleic acid binding domain-containing protein [Coccidioides immitis H538.4]TPX21654.1 hypothetical protein DIZ76_015613 [Coccidioides immitis]EAS34065.1 OB-fold nucleic acid binding domain-containing protein [Coccidi
MAAGYVPRNVIYYPEYCHRAAPTFFTWVKLGVADVRRLTQPRGFEGQGIYFYNNLPVQYICLAGVIVSRDDHDHRTILVLDDSTGYTIEVVCSKAPPSTSSLSSVSAPASTVTNRTGSSLPTLQNIAETDPGITHIASNSRSPIDISPLQPGAVAKFKGTITRFRGMLQLHLERYTLLDDTNAEVRFWEEKTRYFVQVLSVPWVLSAEEMGDLRAEHVREEEMRRKKKKDKQAREEMKRKRKKAKQAKEDKRQSKPLEEERDRAKIANMYARDDWLRRKYAETCREDNQVFMDGRAR